MRLIRVKAHPGERRERVEVHSPDHFEVWVKAPAERGLVKGAHTPSKLFAVH